MPLTFLSWKISKIFWCYLKAAVNRKYQFSNKKTYSQTCPDFSLSFYIYIYIYINYILHCKIKRPNHQVHKTVRVPGNKTNPKKIKATDSCRDGWKVQKSVETTQILEYSYSHFNQFQKVHIQPILYISSITSLYISSIPKNLYVAWWIISYFSSIPTWIRYQNEIKIYK